LRFRFSRGLTGTALLIRKGSYCRRQHVRCRYARNRRPAGICAGASQRGFRSRVLAASTPVAPQRPQQRPHRRSLRSPELHRRPEPEITKKESATAGRADRSASPRPASRARVRAANLVNAVEHCQCGFDRAVVEDPVARAAPSPSPPAPPPSFGQPSNVGYNV
jgi:hypothetical protein